MSKKTTQKKEQAGKTAHAAVKPAELGAGVAETKTEQSKIIRSDNEGGRDFSKFTLISGAQKLEGLSKGRLALSIVRFYLQKNKGATMSKLKEIFPAELVKPYGVIQELPAAKRITAKSGRDRYFMKADEVIAIKGKKVVVTNQWGKKEMDLLIPIARKLGMTVK
jgi:hypothetical protein